MLSPVAGRPLHEITWKVTWLPPHATRGRVLFATATGWVTQLTDAHRNGRLPGDLVRLRR